MRRALAAALLFVATCSGVGAQAYPGITPQPQTTDAATLRALASEREVAVRIRIAFDAIGRGEWSRAIPDLERVVALAPREPQGSTAYYDLGIAHANAGDPDAAARDFSEAIGRDPGFLAARANLVGVELMRGDLRAARVAADALIHIAPESARGLYESGIVALRAGDTQRALGDFRSLLAHDPKYAVGHYDLALALSRANDDADSERELKLALDLAPNYARASIALGAVLLREGKKDEARAAFDTAAHDAQDLALRTLATSLRDAIANGRN